MKPFEPNLSSLAVARDVLAEGEGVVSGQLDPDFLAGVRESLPALKHRKM